MHRFPSSRKRTLHLGQLYWGERVSSNYPPIGYSEEGQQAPSPPHPPQKKGDSNLEIHHPLLNLMKIYQGRLIALSKCENKKKKV
ncbi:hypothetical protein FKM82_028102 [Ascaphus truei]